MEKRTDDSILQELGIKRELLGRETVHGQHQAVDKNDNITVRTGCRRPQSLEGNRQSSVSDGGQEEEGCFYLTLKHT